MQVEQLDRTFAGRKEAARLALAEGCDPETRPLVDAGLTRRQAEIFLFVFRRSLATGTQPSVREIGEHFCIASPNGVVATIKAIAKKGWWEQDADGSSRSLKFKRTPTGATFRGFVCK